MKLGIRGKFSLIGLGLTLFVALSGLVGYRFSQERTLMKNSVEKGRILGEDLALQSEEYLVRGSDLELRDLVERFAGIKGVSYILITDQEGKIRANTLRDQGRVESIIQRDGGDAEKARAIRFAQGRGYGLTIPILEGTLGAVHLGFSSFAQKSRDYWMIAGVFFGGSLLLSWVLVFLFSHRLSSRLLRLAQVTERVSLGYMEERIIFDSRDEIGKLAQATDRLRISLQTALERLGKGEGIERT